MRLFLFVYLFFASPLFVLTCILTDVPFDLLLFFLGGGAGDGLANGLANGLDELYCDCLRFLFVLVTSFLDELVLSRFTLTLFLLSLFPLICVIFGKYVNNPPIFDTFKNFVNDKHVCTYLFIFLTLEKYNNIACNASAG